MKTLPGIFCILLSGLLVHAQDKPGCTTHDVHPSFPYSDGWLGGDGALSVCLPDGRILWIFSDSYVSGDPMARTRRESKTMVNNVIALASYEGGEQEISYHWRKPPQKRGRKHQSFFLTPDPELKFWPSLAFTRHDTLFVLMTRVRDKEDPDPEDIFSFTLNGMTMAMVTGIQAADPLEWQVAYIPFYGVIPGESLNQEGIDENYLYAFKHSEEGSFLIRVPLDALQYPEEAAEYWSLEELWKPGAGGEDQKILFTGQCNGSLDYFPELDCWVHVYGPNFLSNEIRYRHAPEITGPWSEDELLYVTPEQTPGDTSYDQRHFCYLARVHPLFSNPDSGKFLVIYDCNSTEFFHVAGSDEIYIPIVIELDVPAGIRE